MRFTRLAVLLLLFVLLLAVGRSANAQLSFTLDTPTLTGAPGDTIAFSAMLFNTSSTDALSLDGSSLTITGPGALTDLFGNTLPTLAPLQMQQLVLFTVAVDAGALNGDMILGDYSIDYTPGTNPGVTTAPQTFTVQVLTPAANVPEPSGALLLPMAAMGLYMLRVRRICSKAN